MMGEYIRKEDAVYVINSKCYELKGLAKNIIKGVQELPPADVLPYSIDPDGTLTITVPKGIKKIGRILIEEDGTRYGGLFYPDTGGCFLSSMERG